MRCGDHYPTRVGVIDPTHIRVVHDQGSADDPEQVGDTIAIGAEYAPHGSIRHAVECADSANLRLEDIDLFACNCFGFLEHNCDGSVYDRCRIDRRPTASEGEAVNNRLTGNWGEAIKVSPEYWWLELGSSSNVEIRGNTIADCRSAGIGVYAHNGRGELAPSGAHNSISVSGNTLTGCPQPNILVTSTTGLRLADNICRPSETARLSGHMLWMFRLDPEKLGPVMTLNCLGD